MLFINHMACLKHNNTPLGCCLVRHLAAFLPVVALIGLKGPSVAGSYPVHVSPSSPSLVFKRNFHPRSLTARKKKSLEDFLLSFWVSVTFQGQTVKLPGCNWFISNW